MNPCKDRTFFFAEMINWSQMEGSVFPTGFESLGEDSVHENPPMGTLNAAIFDAELDLSMGMGDEVQLHSSGAVSTPQSMTGMMNSVLPLERPISPSEFLCKPAPSAPQQLEDCSISPDVEKMIEEVLPNTSTAVNWDACHIDLNLFNPHEPDAVDSVMQEWDILEVIGLCLKEWAYFKYFRKCTRRETLNASEYIVAKQYSTREDTKKL